MASWSAITNASWTGRIITATEWNNYFGAGGSLVYLKEGYAKYYTSFYVLRSVPPNTTTVGTSFRIPSAWKAGLYFTAMNVFVNGNIIYFGVIDVVNLTIKMIILFQQKI